MVLEHMQGLYDEQVPPPPPTIEHTIKSCVESITLENQKTTWTGKQRRYK